MSDFVLNLLRRGAGMAPVISPRVPDFPDELPSLSDAEQPGDERVDPSDAENLGDRPTTPIPDAVAPPPGRRGQSPPVGPLAAGSPADGEAVEMEAAVPAARITPSRRIVPAAVPNLDTPTTTPLPQRLPDPMPSVSPGRVISPAAPLSDHPLEEILLAPVAPAPTESTAAESPSSRVQVVEPAPPSLPHGESEPTDDAGVASAESTAIPSLQPVIPSPAGVALPALAEPFSWQPIPPMVRAEEHPVEDRRIQVNIGRIEIRQAAPPQAPPRRQPRGFEEQGLARRYLDRRWY